MSLPTHKRQTFEKPLINCDFHVVGIGVPSGNLEAIGELFKSIPDNTDAAYLMVPSNSSGSMSGLHELLADKTGMAVKPVVDRMPLETNTVYLVPSDLEVKISDGQLVPGKNGQSGVIERPIDQLFQSLARNFGSMSIGVILSGTETEGSRGIEEILEAGGLVLCQKPKAAKRDDVPAIAQDTHSVHFLTEPAKFGKAIEIYTNPRAGISLIENEMRSNSDIALAMARPLEESIKAIPESSKKLSWFKHLVDSSVESIVGTDLNGNITTWNQGATEFHGYLDEEVLGKPVSILVPEAIRERTLQLFRQAANGRPIVQHPTESLSKSGQVRPIQLTISPVVDANGQLTGLSSFSHPLSQQPLPGEHQRKLAEILEQTSDFVGSCNAKGETTMINPAGRQMMQLPEDFEVVGKSITHWHTDEMAQMILDQALPTALREGLWEGRTSVTARDGKEVPLSAVIVAHKDQAGNLEYYSMIGRDITQQLELEKEQSDREAFLRKTLDSLASFAGVLLPDGTLIEANQPALQAANLTSEEVIGKPFADTYWWSYSTSVQDQLREAIRKVAGGESVRYDVSVRLADDVFITIDFQLTPLRNHEGKITHLIPSGVDISERVKSESQSRVFRRAFESSLTAMLITDATQRDNPIVYVNPGFESLTGYSADETIGRNCRFLQGPETDRETVSKLRGAIEQGKSCQVKLLNYRKDGTPFWNELVVTPVYSEQDELAFFIGIQFDMTEHLRAEEKLSRARDVAEAANAAKSAFVANISHEIRTPLTTIVGMTEELLDQEPDREKRDLLQLIHQSGNHLITLVNDVLDMSKIEAGKLEADLVKVSPTQIIDDIADTMRFRSNEKGLEFDLQYVGLFPKHVLTDPVRFRQVLFNLTGNAIKFTESGKITLRCEIIDHRTNPMMQIDVMDTGIGIAKNEIKKLFEQFSQVDTSPTRRRGGTGLGLYISRRLVQLMGGTLTATSEPGKGSCFTLCLPTGSLADGNVMAPSVMTRNVDPSRAAGKSDIHLNGRVLVVEDTRGIQRLLQRMLENAGAEVELVDDGQAALERFSSNENTSFDLVLLDMHMPRLSGYETASELRRRGIEIPIIALTASAMRGDREKCLNVGCNDYLTKPIDREKLLAKVAELMN